MKLLSAGRMAEVFVFDNDRVVKLDRPEWNGVSGMESEFIAQVAEAGLPVARSHGVVTIDGRCGVVLDRLEGPSLLEVIGGATPGADALAERFVALQGSINDTKIDGLPDLVNRLRSEIQLAGLSSPLEIELTELLAHLDDGSRGVCHFDFHPDNVIVTAAGWFVIDWLGLASGPSVADLARTLLLIDRLDEPSAKEFSHRVRRHGLIHHGQLDESVLDGWIRIGAAARLAEGFAGDYADVLRSIAEGTATLGD